MIYNHKTVEKKWQEKWEKDGLYTPDIKNTKSKDTFYNLWMFPYPSAEGLHAGHAFASTGSDIYGRFMRMNGKTVFQPIGYDSFGIHSENYAIKIGENPHEVVKRTTANYELQMRALGHGYDWTRTVTTSDSNYYRWTQWLFVEMYKAGLAYRKNAEVNFCPSCKTVLADEQVMTPKQAGKEPKDKDGNIVPDSDELKVCERCGTIAEKRNLDQWFFKITDYADRLLSGLNEIDWSPRVAMAQKEWIGKKEGVKINHKVKDLDITLTAFSAYPAWLFADTFLVVAPEHPIVSELVRGTKFQIDVEKFVENFKKNKNSRGSKLDDKEGIFTGRFVIDPFNGIEMPVYLANFALMGFGTGIIRCSAHDPRDYEFAKKYDIELKEIVERTDPELPVNAHTNEGNLKDSGLFTNKSITPKLISEMLDWIENQKIGERNTNYHLRDWLVSRQRYWGPPIPMINCSKCGWQVEENLPVLLPDIKDYQPEGNGRGPLANHPEFFEVKCPSCGGDAKRETDVMDTFVDSSWYFLRYPSVDLDNNAFDKEISKNWLPVDLYFGGAEHSVLHLMYARFVNMVMKDRGYLDHDEPFPKFFAHGLMIKDGAKMSKSRGNVINPDQYVEKYGSDTLRLYVMFMGPMDGYPDFRDSGIEGMSKFIKRILNLFDKQSLPLRGKKPTKDDLLSKMHLTIKAVTDDIKQFKYNTSIAKIMEFVNELTKYKVLSTKYLAVLTQLLAPFAPHIAEELWSEVLKQKGSVHLSSWPEYDEKYLKSETITIAIQVNGKLRSTVTVSNNADKESIISLAKSDEKMKTWIEGNEIKKEIFVAGKLVNFVI